MRRKRIELVRRRVLRAAVEENVATIRGTLPRPLRRSTRTLWQLTRVFAVIALPLAVVGSTHLISTLDRPSRDLSHSSFRPAPAAALKTATPPARRQTFSAPAPFNSAAFPLKVRTVILDAGHGGSNPGTASAGLVEKELALDIVTRLRILLEASSYKVAITRTGDETISLLERAQRANAANGDIFVSVHLNWIRNPKHGGVETYYLGPTNDPQLVKLAAHENRDSGYSLRDLRKLLDGVYADVRQDESHGLAETIHESLFRGLSTGNPKLANRGVKRAPFVVLLATDMPAILTEVASMSNATESELLKDPQYRQKIAQSLFAGIDSYARQRGEPDEKGS